ncbi:class I SAM-dependent methyltransferase [Actinoplanes sp. NPDC024001]|uniref:class I SAM-dependent methyltransferase n=1 Tax=Actinoplanes sp. NPDC024001 TaxID=3154598 RepID=UPI0033EE13A2
MKSEQTRRSARVAAADMAATAALLQVAAELGVDQFLDGGEPFTVAELAGAADTPEGPMTEYLAALLAAGLVVTTGDNGDFQAAPDYANQRNHAGYLCWALNANRPFIENAPMFFRDLDGAAKEHQRNSRRVAVSSRWIGTRDFYPAAFDLIVRSGAGHVADLGAGAAGLLIQLLSQDHGRTGMALDISESACAEARKAAERAGVAGRLEVIQRSVQSLADDPSPVAGADVIHAGFVFHDVVGDEATFDAMLRSCATALASDGFLAITDAVPYAADERERRFSALFTYLHAGFMNVRLPTEKAWIERFRAAGFSHVEVVPHEFPGGRLFIVQK